MELSMKIPACSSAELRELKKAIEFVVYNHTGHKPVWQQTHVSHSSGDTIEDGFGGVWSKRCPMCGRNGMQVMRPGKVQCRYCG